MFTAINAGHSWTQSGRVGQGVAIKVESFPVQTPLGARLGFGTQTYWEVAGELWVKIVKTQ